MLFLKRLYWKWLYRKIDRSFIYEVARNPHVRDQINLYGPINSDTIRLLTKKSKEQNPGYEYVQVIDGCTMSFFKKDELLFLDRPL